MKHLVLTLWFVLFLGSFALAGVEYVTESVCLDMSGCVLDTKTGECPDCVIERREVVHTHEETPVIVEKPVIVETHIRTVATITKKKPLVVKTTPKKIITWPSNKKWVGTLWKCVIACPSAYWDDAGNHFDKNMNLVSN